MSLGGGAADSNNTEDTPLNSTINTTPLVDVMLVMLIIFLITVPVVVATVKVKLPDETNKPTISKPENISITVDKAGQYYWNVYPIELSVIQERLRKAAYQKPQPEVHISGDGEVYYQSVARIIDAAQRSGIARVGFITRPMNPGE
jgi:biopolymer transport protein ExbD